MTEHTCTCKHPCKTHVARLLQDISKQIDKGANICAKVGTGSWGRRVASCTIENGDAVVREGGTLGREIWRAPLAAITHPNFSDKHGVKRLEAAGVEPLLLHSGSQ